ncbi:unnamed protein product [Penicillium egyptiacum]|uniref:Uncharacterized protein n=1 Tax=Penicillium egyptiacum TaxID=1303716 RepID=A0A9W4KP83_9EURO|nr:unnamed protein product [Penicillium egyptiacum]
MQFIQEGYPYTFPQQLERLPSELLQHIIELRFFSKPLGSHYALYQLRLLIHESNPSLRIRREIGNFIQSVRTREMIRTRWSLYINYEEAVSHLPEIPRRSEKDIATSTLTECQDCFNFMLDYGAILPPYYNNDGHSFFALAYSIEKNREILYRLISLTEPKQLLKPLSIGLTDTIFQQTVTCAKVFKICWDRLDSDPDLDLSFTLRVKHIYDVCKHVNVDLANRMLARRINISLGLATRNGNLTAWHAVAKFHPDPKPIFEWLSKHAWLPTEEQRPAPLLLATQSDRVEAAIWLISHNSNTRNYRIAAMEAAKRQTDESLDILTAIAEQALIIQPKDAALLQDILIEIVFGVCTESKRLLSTMGYLCEQQPWATERHVEQYERSLMSVEDLAIRKIEETIAKSDPFSLPEAQALAASDANLHELAEFLGKLEGK